MTWVADIFREGVRDARCRCVVSDRRSRVVFRRSASGSCISAVLKCVHAIRAGGRNADISDMGARDAGADDLTKAN